MIETSSIQSDLVRGRGWVVILRGLTAVVFGILAFTWSGITVPKLVTLFGIYALAHGLLSIAAAIGSRGQRASGLLATEGIVGLFAGIMTFGTSAPSPMAFVLLVWLWAIATGVLRVIEAIRLRKEIHGDVWLMLSGVVPVLLAAMLLLRHTVGPIGLALIIAIGALLWGVFEILVGCELSGLRHHGRPASGA